MRTTRLKRLLLTATVALLVATAGCSGLTGDDGTNGNGDGPSGSGYDVSGADLDGETLTNATSDAVESGGSYTLETNSTVSATQNGQEQTSASETSLLVDLDGDQGIRNRTQTIERDSSSQTQVSTVYTDGNTSYRKQTTQGQTTYDQQDGSPSSVGGIRPVDTDGFTQNYTGIVDGFSWEQTGSSEVGGVAVTEYSLTGEPDKDTLGLGENTTVEEASGTLYVDGDGVIRQADIAYTVTTEQGSTSIDATTTLTAVGSTTVEEPGWLSEVN
jgi:hypothetical protein